MPPQPDRRAWEFSSGKVQSVYLTAFQTNEKNNVLIDDFGMPIISDYGLSAVQEVLKASTIAPTGQLRYLAPEMILSESIIRPSKFTDVYAFACVVMEVCVPLSSTLSD